MTILHGITILQTSTDLLAYPQNAQMIAILSNGSQDTGNAVMQGTSLGWKQASITFYLDILADLLTIQDAAQTHEEIIYVDHLGTVHSVRILTLSATAQGNGLWECTAVLVETEAFFNYS